MSFLWTALRGWVLLSSTERAGRRLTSSASNPFVWLFVVVLVKVWRQTEPWRLIE